MMRSLFSGVAGLKTHQTRMDVIGNNIANVNTTAYKSQSMVFNDLLYQTSQAASGANAATGRGGINARQIGLGSKTGGISTTITTQGSAQSTNNPWDIMIEGDAFFIVNDGSQNFFTRDGSFTIDGAGNLVMSSTGFTVMGWQVDPDTGEIRSDVVSALRVMHPDNLTAEPEATTLAYMRGILDNTDTDLSSTRGVVRTLKFYDALGFEYTALFSVHATGNDDEYRVQLDDIEDSTGMSLVTRYGLSNINQIASFGGTETDSVTSKYSAGSGVTYDSVNSKFRIERALGEILSGYSSNPLIIAAGKNVGLVEDPDQSGVKPAGSAVLVEGELSLTKAQLEAEPYSLLYNPDDGLYYNSDGPIEDEDDWLNALSAMEGFDPDSFTSFEVEQDPDNPEKVIITFTASFDTSIDAELDASKGVFIVERDYVATGATSNEKEILEEMYGLVDGDGKTYSIDFVGPDGSAQITMTETWNGNRLVFDHDSGKFSYIGRQNNDTAFLEFNSSASSLTSGIIDLTQFSNIEIDFASISHLGNGGKSTLEMTNGSKEDDWTGAGRKTGELIGIEVAQDGKINATYDNGMSKLLGQIAVAEFANPSGLAKAGNNLYDTTLNSGSFDGVGTDITKSGGTMTSGLLEMSNVDLSAEFTTMITTQRGFQANSRIITVSDTLLEELTNLKR